MKKEKRLSTVTAASQELFLEDYFAHFDKVAARSRNKAVSTRHGPDAWTAGSFRAAVYKALESDFKKESGFKDKELEEILSQKQRLFMEGCLAATCTLISSPWFRGSVCKHRVLMCASPWRLLLMWDML